MEEVEVVEQVGGSVGLGVGAWLGLGLGVWHVCRC